MFYRKWSTILLTLCMVLSLMPVTARADNEIIIVSEGEHLEEVSSGQSVEENYGTIGTNNGTVKVNYGTITNNNGTVNENRVSGSVTYNKHGGLISKSGGYVYGNDGTVNWNFGTIDTNRFEVRRNESSGVIYTNRGKVNENYGTIRTNDNYYGDEIVVDNNSTIEVNKSTVSNNYGTVITNANSGVVMNVDYYSAKGSVTGSVTINNGEVYYYCNTPVPCNTSNGTEYYRVVISNLTSHTTVTSSGLKSAYELQWLGETAGVQTTATVTLIPEEGYEIKEIPSLPDNVTSRKNADGTWTLTVTSGKHTTIIIPEETAKPYTVTVNNGSGSRDYAEGESVTITADEPAYDKLFKEWTGTEGLTFTSGSASTSTATFIMPDHDVTVTATYDTGYTLTVRNGTGGGKYAAGASVTITANNPPEGQRFKEWSGLTSSWIISGSKTTPTVTFRMPSFTHVVIATYEEIPPACTVTYKVVNGTWSDGTTADKTETVESGSRPSGVPAGMIASSGYTGGAWDVNPGTTTVNGDRTFTYTFEPVPTCTVTVSPEAGGTVTGDGDYEAGASVALSATPNEGYRFKEWQVVSGGVTVENDRFTMPAEDVEIRAVFERVNAIRSDDGTAEALHEVGWLDWQPVAEAAEGEPLELRIADGAEPEEGYCFTGEFAVNNVSLGVQYDENDRNHLFPLPVTRLTMPAEAITLSAVQAARETVTLDYTHGAALTMPYTALIQLRNGDDTSALFTTDENYNEFIDLDGRGTPDIAVTEPDYETTADFTLTLLPGADAKGGFSFAFAGSTDRYGTITFTMPSIEVPAFGPAAFTLPAALKMIEASAFEGDTALTVVDAYSVTAIGPNAFKGCTNLTQIRLHKDCQIDPTAFDGCGTVYVFAPAGGDAQTSCAAIAGCVFAAEAQD